MLESSGKILISKQKHLIFIGRAESNQTEVALVQFLSDFENIAEP
jgi:hypothetical protein